MCQLTGFIALVFSSLIIFGGKGNGYPVSIQLHVSVLLSISGCKLGIRNKTPE